jgi:hypothetical protein
MTTELAVDSPPDVAGDCLSQLTALTTTDPPPRPLSVPRSFDILPEHPRGRSRVSRRSP